MCVHAEGMCVYVCVCVCVCVCVQEGTRPDRGEGADVLYATATLGSAFDRSARHPCAPAHSI